MNNYKRLVKANLIILFVATFYYYINLEKQPPIVENPYPQKTSLRLELHQEDSEILEKRTLFAKDGFTRISEHVEKRNGNTVETKFNSKGLPYIIVEQFPKSNKETLLRRLTLVSEDGTTPISDHLYAKDGSLISTGKLVKDPNQLKYEETVFYTDIPKKRSTKILVSTKTGWLFETETIWRKNGIIKRTTKRDKLGKIERNNYSSKGTIISHEFWSKDRSKVRVKYYRKDLTVYLEIHETIDQMIALSFNKKGKMTERRTWTPTRINAAIYSHDGEIEFVQTWEIIEEGDVRLSKVEQIVGPKEPKLTYFFYPNSSLKFTVLRHFDSVGQELQTILKYGKDGMLVSEHTAIVDGKMISSKTYDKSESRKAPTMDKRYKQYRKLDKPKSFFKDIPK